MIITAMRQALEALEYALPFNGSNGEIKQAINALRTAIEQAEKQEPVAWAGVDFDIKTAPPQRKPLTDEEIKLVMDGRGEEGDDDYVKPAFDPFGISEEDLMNFARAIESAHVIKGEA